MGRHNNRISGHSHRLQKAHLPVHKNKMYAIDVGSLATTTENAEGEERIPDGLGPEGPVVFLDQIAHDLHAKDISSHDLPDL